MQAKLYDDSVEVMAGDIYLDTRGSEDILYRVVFVDENRVLLKSDIMMERVSTRHYRCDIRKDFERYVRTGRYKEQAESDDAPVMPHDVQAEEYEWGEVEGIGSKTEQSLYDAGVRTDHDVETTDDKKMIELYGMSQRKLELMKEHINW